MDKFYEIPIERRLAESERIRFKYPGRVPVILERHTDMLPSLTQKKFLLPVDLTFRDFQIIVLKRMAIDASLSIYFFVEYFNNGKKKHVLLNGIQSAGDIYNTWKNQDGFLYIYYNTENTFG